MRILTAREQVEMLSSWREAAAVNDWERSHITKNKATDINGDSHEITWEGDRNGYATGERSSGLTPKCSCGWASEVGSETSGRREFTKHIKSIERTARRLAVPIKMAREDYMGSHEAPGPGSGFPLHDLSGNDDLGGVPEDWYTHPHYYTHGEVSPAATKNVQRMYNQTRGNPEAPVDIYRALPHGNDSINTGDWVTPSLEYARQHAMHPDDPAQDLPVIKMTVPAKHLWHNGDSYFEMGYHGPSGKAVTQ